MATPRKTPTTAAAVKETSTASTPNVKLTRDAILGLRPTVHEIDLPGYGTLVIKKLSADMKIELDKKYIMEYRPGQMDTEMMRAAFICSVLDPDTNEHALTMADSEAIGEIPGDLLEHAFREIAKLNGYSAADPVGDAVKN